MATGVWLRWPRLPGLAAIITHPNVLDSVQQRKLGKKSRTLLLISSLGMFFDQNIPEQLVKRKTGFFSPDCTDVQTGTSIFKDFTQMFLIKNKWKYFFNHYPLPKLASQVYTSNFYLRSQSNLLNCVSWIFLSLLSFKKKTTTHTLEDFSRCRLKIYECD